jgi:hypothetical protein
MEAATRQIPALLNATDKISADEVNEETGIPYSSPAQRRTITTMLVDQTLT